MAHVWQGIIKEYADYLPEHLTTHIVTLGEGGTPLVPAPALSQATGATVYLKVEGMNPTGSFKDRGMTTAISAAAARGAKAVVCASTGNTSASAAAYATHAGMVCAVLVPDGKIAMGKLSQAIAHGAQLLQVDGNFDDCLVAARKLAEAYPVELVNSVNPDRIEGQKTGSFEVVDVLGDAPDIHALPVGNAGNITAYWKGTRNTTTLVRPQKPPPCGVFKPKVHPRSLLDTRLTNQKLLPPLSALGTPRPGTKLWQHETPQAVSLTPSQTTKSLPLTGCCPPMLACLLSQPRPLELRGSSSTLPLAACPTEPPLLLPSPAMV